MNTTTYSATCLVPARDLLGGMRIAHAMGGDLQWLTVRDVSLQDADPRFATVRAASASGEVEWTSWSELRYAALTPGECMYQVSMAASSPCAAGTAICAAHRGEMLRLHSSMRR